MSASLASRARAKFHRIEAKKVDQLKFQSCLESPSCSISVPASPGSQHRQLSLPLPSSRICSSSVPTTPDAQHRQSSSVSEKSVKPCAAVMTERGEDKSIAHSINDGDCLPSSEKAPACLLNANVARRGLLVPRFQAQEAKYANSIGAANALTEPALFRSQTVVEILSGDRRHEDHVEWICNSSEHDVDITFGVDAFSLEASKQPNKVVELPIGILNMLIEMWKQLRVRGFGEGVTSSCKGSAKPTSMSGMSTKSPSSSRFSLSPPLSPQQSPPLSLRESLPITSTKDATFLKDCCARSNSRPLSLEETSVVHQLDHELHIGGDDSKSHSRLQATLVEPVCTDQANRVRIAFDQACLHHFSSANEHRTSSILSARESVGSKPLAVAALAPLLSPRPSGRGPISSEAPASIRGNISRYLIPSCAPPPCAPAAAQLSPRNYGGPPSPLDSLKASQTSSASPGSPSSPPYFPSIRHAPLETVGTVTRRISSTVFLSH